MLRLFAVGMAQFSALLLLGGCAQNKAAGEIPPAEAPPLAEVAPPLPPRPTVVLDPVEAKRLLAAKSVTLQWIGWDRRGDLNVREADGTIFLTGAQSDSSGPGQLFLDGWVEEVGSGYFVFRGTIRITDTPDPGRQCEREKLWHFAVTQNRPYWRLREFEWCDYLTDYIDIYF